MLCRVEGLLCRAVWLTEVGQTRQVVVPSVMVAEVLHHLHGTPLTGHLAYEHVVARPGSVPLALHGE